MAGTITEPLYWDDAYPIALALKAVHPDTDPIDVDPKVLHGWVIALRDFADDPAMVRGEWLVHIQAEWVELI